MEPRKVTFNFTFIFLVKLLSKELKFPCFLMSTKETFKLANSNIKHKSLLIDRFNSIPLPIFFQMFLMWTKCYSLTMISAQLALHHTLVSVRLSVGPRLLSLWIPVPMATTSSAHPVVSFHSGSVCIIFCRFTGRHIFSNSSDISLWKIPEQKHHRIH